MRERKEKLKVEKIKICTATPVDLRYDALHPKDSSKTERPLVILHGLFGMKRNWLSLSKAFHRDLQRSVYTLDLRNHGSSPHAMPMNYEAMTTDVIHFLRSHSLSNISLLGHSMGGKVAMAVALSPDLPAHAIEHLVVADIAPSISALSLEFQGYIEAMKKIEKIGVSSRREAQDILAHYEPDPMTRAFLLTNLDTTVRPLKFQVPLDIIGSSIPDLGSFPYEPGERSWHGSTLFVKGSKSKYISKNNVPIAKEFFPSMSLETLDAGHWVHADKPNEFKKLVVDFITRS
ncbi:alpha/beta-hydrolase [Multifurca ochricompacta]|uniref:Alpha/beta-hydrolase n=1 Tax=Multifurca ochricompacta TaxID=376703 RepID=A0AAD4LUP1_9AGAM|nr:alpha/beta-hydrolase [Multifurca ochricompacta]